MSEREIFQFENPRDIFAYVFHQKTQKNPQFSVRAWSKKLGFRNPSHVADVLKGRRNLTTDFGLRVSDSLDLSAEAKTYFETLVFYINASSTAEKNYYETILQKIKPTENKVAIEPDKFAVVKEWYYGVLDEMTCLADFNPDPAYLAKRLGGEVTPAAVQVALADLVRLRSIERMNKGGYVRPKRVYFRESGPTDELLNPILRKYQRQFIEKTLTALDEQTKAESYFRMSNIPIRRKHFEEFRSQIEDFVSEMNSRETTRGADEVYLLAVQFCRLTEPKKS